MKRILLFPDAPTAAPGAPPAPAPTAPTPAPSPAPASAAPPAPEPSPSGGDDPFAALDAKFAAADKPASSTKGKEPEAKPKPGAAPAAKPADPAKPAPKAAADNFATLRQAKEAAEKELASTRTNLTALEAKLKDHDEKGRDTTALLGQIETIRKEKEAIQAELRMLKKESSPEFKEKYDAPFDRAAEFAQNVVNGLEKTDGQPGTWDDFVGIYGIAKQSLNRAIAEARAKYGDNAQLVIQQLTDLHRLDFEREKARTREREEWQTRTKEDEGKAAEQRTREETQRREQEERFKSAFQKLNEDLETSVDGYKFAPDDKELSTARSEGLAVLDAKPRDHKEFLVKQAHIRQRTAAYLPNQILIARLKSEVAKLKTELEGKNPSPPAGGRRAGGDNNAKPEKSWEQEAREAIN